MRLNRQDCIDALREFEEQNHDWLDVLRYSPSLPADDRRQSTFRYLADLGYVVELSAENFLGEDQLSRAEDGRWITGAAVYRITAEGRDLLSSKLEANRISSKVQHWMKSNWGLLTFVCGLLVSCIVFLYQVPSNSGFCQDLREWAVMGKLVTYIGACMDAAQN